MTLVSFLKLSKDSGMACADERETHGRTRVYDVTRKIIVFKGAPVYTGMSGSVADCREIIDEVFSKTNDDPNYRKILHQLKLSYKVVRDMSFQEGMLDKYNLSWSNIHRGDIDPDLRKEIRSALEEGRGFSAVFILGGYDTERDGYYMHVVDYPGRSFFIDNYETIGTGRDRSDIVIGDALHHMSHEERTRIEPYKGAKILMEAAQSAWKNTGVGGMTQLVWSSGSDVREIETGESNLLNNTLYFEKRGYLDAQYVDTLFARIIQDGAKSGELLPDIREKSGHDIFENLMTQCLIQ